MPQIRVNKCQKSITLPRKNSCMLKNKAWSAYPHKFQNIRIKEGNAEKISNKQYNLNKLKSLIFIPLLGGKVHHPPPTKVLTYWYHRLYRRSILEHKTYCQGCVIFFLDFWLIFPNIFNIISKIWWKVAWFLFCFDFRYNFPNIFNIISKSFATCHSCFYITVEWWYNL